MYVILYKKICQSAHCKPHFTQINYGESSNMLTFYMSYWLSSIFLYLHLKGYQLYINKRKLNCMMHNQEERWNKLWNVSMTFYWNGLNWSVCRVRICCYWFSPSIENICMVMKIITSVTICALNWWDVHGMGNRCRMNCYYKSIEAATVRSYIMPSSPCSVNLAGSLLLWALRPCSDFCPTSQRCILAGWLATVCIPGVGGWEEDKDGHVRKNRLQGNKQGNEADTMIRSARMTLAKQQPPSSRNYASRMPQ